MTKPKNMTPEQEAEWKAKKNARNRERRANPELREKDNARRRERRANDPEYREKDNASRREHRANDPEYREKENARNRGRRFRKTTIINHLLVHQRGKCAICHTCVIEKHHLDHIIPLAKGGTNDKANLQLLCAPCNLQKSAADPIEHAQRMGKLL